MSYSEIIVTGVIVALVFFAVWRVGQMNPVGTGQLARRLTQVESRVRDFDTRLSGIEGTMESAAKSAAKAAATIEAMSLELAGDRGLQERTWSAVDRMQHFFIDRALEQAFGRDRKS